MADAGETIGDRIFAVRVALGRGPRKPMSQRAFAALLTRSSGRKYESSSVSMMETGQRRVSLDDVEAIAAVDPRQRGRVWLAWGEGASGAAPLGELPLGVRSAPDADNRVTLESVDALEAAERKRRRKGGGS